MRVNGYCEANSSVATMWGGLIKCFIFIFVETCVRVCVWICVHVRYIRQVCVCVWICLHVHMNI